ncbi:MAG: PRC-barrel domain-containing protein [Bacteroidota bacterium]
MTTYNVDEQTVRDLFYLKDLNGYEVHEEDIDVRGWDIYDRTGIKFGEVERLIVSKEDRRVRYIVVQTADTYRRKRDAGFFERVGNEIKDFFGTDEDRSIIIPVGMIEIDEEDQRVNAFGYDSYFYVNSPRYTVHDRNFVSPGFELAAMRYYTNDDEAYRDFYRKEDFKEYSSNTNSTISDRNFYNTSLFSKRRSKNANSTTMATVDTGARKY